MIMTTVTLLVKISSKWSICLNFSENGDLVKNLVFPQKTIVLLEKASPHRSGYSRHDMMKCRQMIPSHDMMTCHDMMKCHEMITSHDMNFTDDGVPWDDHKS